MDLDKINGSNYNFPYDPDKKTGNGDNFKKNNLPLNRNEKKSPSNPRYWQAISFSGNKKQANEDKNLQTLIDMETSIFSKKTKERYRNLLDDAKSFLTFDTDPISAFYFANRLKQIAQNEKNYEINRNFLLELYQNKDVDSETKILYISKILPEDIIKAEGEVNFDEIKDEFFSYSILIPALKNSNASLNALADLNLPSNMIKKTTSLIESGTISKDDFASLMISALKCPKDKGIKPLSDILDEIEKDPDKISFLRLLFPGVVFAYDISLELINDILKENSSETKEVLEHIKDKIDNKYGKGYLLWHNSKNAGTFLNSISKENKDDVIELIDTTKGMPLEGVGLCGAYTNPVTGYFDKDIYSFAKELCTYKHYGYTIVSDATISAAKACVDSKTGKVSPLALKFLDKYFFRKDDDKLSTRFKMFKTRFKSKSTNPKMYYQSVEMSAGAADLVNALKDNEGAFNLTNYKCLSKIMESDVTEWFSYLDLSFIPLIKDEKGIIDKNRLNYVIQAAKKRGGFSGIGDFISAAGKYPPDKLKSMTDDIISIYNDPANAYQNFPVLCEFCFDKNGNRIDKNFEFIKQLNTLSTGALYGFDYTKEFLDVCGNDNNKEFALELINISRKAQSNINWLAEVYKRYQNDEGELDEFLKDKLREYVDNKAPLYHFCNCYEICKDKDGKINDEKFSIMSKFLSMPEISNFFRDKPFDILDDIVNGNSEPLSKLDFSHRIAILDALKSFRENPVVKFRNEFNFIDKLISDIDSSLDNDKIMLDVKKEDIIAFAAKCLNSKDGKRTDFETTIISSIPKLKQMNKGLPLSYSREKFLSALNALLDTKEKRQLISDKLNINFIEQNGLITGYDGIMLLDNLNKNNEFENSIYEICHKFFYENKINTGDKKLDDALNVIISAMPEFINTIGKKQHKTHNYTLDIHHLLVLANSINNPDYDKLNKTDKTMLKLSSLIHDIAKRENIVDKGHQTPSSLYARSIIKKIFKNPEARDRVYELIKNHHWLEEYVHAYGNEDKLKDLAYRFRRPNDFEIAKIMARADLMAVSDEFYKDHKAPLKTVEPVEEKLQYFYSTGCAVFSDHIVNKTALKTHIQTKDGVKYPVIDFHKIKDDEDMGKYGFSSGRTKKDMNFLVHMVDSDKIYTSLNNLKQLSTSINGGVMSESLITPYHKRTYAYRKYGVLLSQINSNIINISGENQGSGTSKDMKSALTLVFEPYSKERREHFKEHFLKNLGFKQDEISDEEFAKFYKENIAPKTSINQFLIGKEYTLGNKTLKGKDIRKAISDYQNSLIDKKDRNHNEIVGYTPKLQAVIAFEDSLDNVPDDLLKFADENKLPVILL